MAPRTKGATALREDEGPQRKLAVAAASVVPRPLATIAEVESTVTDIARLDREVTRLQTEFNENQSKLAAEYSPRIDPLLSDRHSKEELVLQFARDNRASIKGKTWKLRFAVVKFSNAAVRVEFLQPLLQIIANLKKNKLANLVKIEETVEKNDLKALEPRFRPLIGFSVNESPEKAKLEIDYQKFQLNELQQAGAVQ